MSRKTIDKEAEMKKNVFYGCLSCLTVILTAIFLCTSAQAAEFTADIFERIFNHDVTGKIYVKDDKYRMDLLDKKTKEKPVITVDRKGGFTRLFNAEIKQYQEIKNFSFQAFMVDPFQSLEKWDSVLQKKKVGTESVAGYVCNKYEYYDGTAKLAEAWVARDLNFPVKMHIKSGRSDGSIKVKTNIGDTIVKLSNIKKVSVNATLFEIPAGYAKAEKPKRPAGKKPVALSSVSGTVKGKAPWGRRIAVGGEMVAAVNPKQSVRLKVKNLVTEESVFTVKAFRQGKAINIDIPKTSSLKRKGETRDLLLGLQNKAEEVAVRVEKGLVVAMVTAEPSAFAREKVKELFLMGSGQGFFIDTKRKLSVTLTGDSQDGPDSEVKITFYKGSYKDKIVEEKFILKNKKSKSWEFAPDKKVQTLEVSVNRTGGVKFRLEQPAPVQTAPKRRIIAKPKPRSMTHTFALKKPSGRGEILYPGKKLVITITGNSPSRSVSRGDFTLYTGTNYQGKIGTIKYSVNHGQSKYWKFSQNKHVGSINLYLLSGGVKVKLDQSPTAGIPSTAKAQPAVMTPTASVPARKGKSKSAGPRLSKQESTVILKAINANDIATVKAYLDRGMDPNSAVYGSPLLQKAANLGSAEMVKLVIARGGDLNYKSRSGNDALALAMSNSKHWREIVPLLVKAGITINKQTPFWKIVFKTKNGKFKPGAKEILELLLSKGAHVDCPIVKDGTTSLMYTAKKAWLEPVNFFLAHGADVNAKNTKGDTVLSLAIKKQPRERPYQTNNRKAIIKLLKAKGAK